MQLEQREREGEGGCEDSASSVETFTSACTCEHCHRQKMDEDHQEEIFDENGVLSKRDNEMEATRTFKKMEMEGTELSKTYKKMAASILKELETSLGRELPEVEQFMFVHGTAECRSASILQSCQVHKNFLFIFQPNWSKMP